jgi:hypothetical protein
VFVCSDDKHRGFVESGQDFTIAAARAVNRAKKVLPVLTLTKKLFFGQPKKLFFGQKNFFLDPSANEVFVCSDKTVVLLSRGRTLPSPPRALSAKKVKPSMQPRTKKVKKGL